MFASDRSAIEANLEAIPLERFPDDLARKPSSDLLTSHIYMSAPELPELPMTYARKTLISLRDTPYYHVVARCVRRAWLWGTDEYAGRDYSHPVSTHSMPGSFRVIVDLRGVLISSRIPKMHEPEPAVLL
jgi:hypothetical protein